MIQKGFSLIELMVAMAVLGILAAVAVPAYTEYVGQGYRTEAMRELITVANLQEQYFIENKTYTADMTDLGFSADPYKSENERYEIDTTINTDGDEFTITATASTAQVSVDYFCASLSITHLLVKSALDKDGNDATSDCWGKK